MNENLNTRILALEIRYRRFGFAVLEGMPLLLLDTGTRTFATPAAVVQRLEPVISLFDPQVIVVRRPGHRNPRHRNGVQSILRVIRKEATRRSIQMEPVAISEIQRVFRESGATKEIIATAITKIFPELQWKVPPKRKPWVSEGHNMVIFDAAATGIAFLARHDAGKKSP
jgi:hypothetical protein